MKIIARKLVQNWRGNISKRVNSTKTSKSDWKSVVGLEIHAQIDSSSKLFSSSGTKFAAPPNSQVSFVDAAFPGTLPVLNKRCVEAAILTAIALNCQVHKFSTFDRKHYFYADLPAGYQITQQRCPIATNGFLNFTTYNVAIGRGPDLSKSVIKQIQLEQDSGKSLHDAEHSRSLIDLNRAGMGLMELVFEPDLSDGEEAGCLVKELCLILERLGTCTCRMEEGALRVDANISVHKQCEPLGVRTEVKNLNSIRSVAKAIDYEIKRQIKILENGGRIVNETRSFNNETYETQLMRDKEVLQDYRFMPEPNLPPLILTDNAHKLPGLINIDQLREQIPKLPEDDRQMLIEKYGMTVVQALTVVNMEGLQSYFERIVSKPNRDPKLVLNWLLISIQKHLKELDLTYANSPVQHERIGELMDLLIDMQISSGTANHILNTMFAGDSNWPRQIVDEKKLYLITDQMEIEQFCAKVIEENPKLVKMYRKGKDKGLQLLVKEVLKASNERCHTKSTIEIVKKMLN